MARKTVLIFLGCIFSGFVLFGQSARELFDLGNEAYKSGQYQEALFQYENALKQPEGENSAALHYNLANCYYKTNQLGLSILHYEKTLKLNPDREEAEYNLELANARIVDKV
ncbi:MAG: tetratricopeptide repeat protein, partial [Luteibaculum sp.]